MFSINLDVINNASYEMQNQIRQMTSIQDETTEVMNGLNLGDEYNEVRHELKCILEEESEEKDKYIKMLNCLKNSEEAYKNTEKKICEYADSGIAGSPFGNAAGSMMDDGWVAIDRNTILSGGNNIKYII